MWSTIGSYIVLIFGIGNILNGLLVSRVSNFSFSTLFPLILGVICTAVGCLKLTKFKDTPLIPHSGVRITLLCVLGVFLLSFVNVQYLIIKNGQEQSEKGDALIVLGAALHGNKPSRALVNRLELAADWLETNPNAPVIVTGGQGAGELETEAEVMRTFLIKRGVAPKRIYMEDQATNTLENFTYSKPILEKAGVANKKIVVVTNDFHLFRSKMLANRVGIQCEGLGAQTPIIIQWNSYVREYFAVLKSFMVDRM
ncbi:MAG: YdcF family protein [Bacilli bacterium]